MKKASLVIKEIQEGSYNDILKVVYIDENRIEKQPQRYVEAIEKFNKSFFSFFINFKDTCIF